MECIDYHFYEKQCKSKYSRPCINGDIVNCSKCVGYCEYEEHPGFLTEALRRQHNCLYNECGHYIEKPKNSKSAKQKSNKTTNKNSNVFDEQVVNLANNLCCEMEGIRFIKAEKIGKLHWKLSYITISNEYQTNDLCNFICEESGFKISLEKLNYEYETCVKLIFGLKK